MSVEDDKTPEKADEWYDEYRRTDDFELEPEWSGECDISYQYFKESPESYVVFSWDDGWIRSSICYVLTDIR